MPDDKTIEQRKAEYRFEQLSGKINELCGENGSMICGIYTDDVNSISMRGQFIHIVGLMGVLIRQLAEGTDYSTADVLDKLRNCVEFMEKVEGNNNE